MCFGPVPKNDPMTTEKEGSKAVTAVIRWSARVLGVIMAGFLLCMFFGYFLEGRNPSSDSLTPFAAFGLVLMGIYALAMFLALKWERTGSVLGAIVLGCFFTILFLGLLPGNVSGGFSAKGVLNPVFLVLWLPLLLYFTCWRIEKRRIS
jgi:small-conductance mechanosensitive channel